MDHSISGADVSSESCAVDSTGRDDATIEQVESAASTTVFLVDASDAPDEGARQDTEAASEQDTSAELCRGTEMDVGSPGGGAGKDATALRNLVGDRAASPSNCPPSKDGPSNGTLNIETGTSSQSEATTASVSPQPIDRPSVRPPPTFHPQQLIRGQLVRVGVMVRHYIAISPLK